MAPAPPPNVVTVLEALKACIVAVTLIYTSILDIRTREVEPRLWLLPGILAGALSLLELPLITRRVGAAELATHLAGSGLVVAAILAMYLIGMMGGGDLFAATLMLAAHPWPFLLRDAMPALLPLLFYASLAAVTPSLYFLAVNMLRHRGELSRLHGCNLICKAYMATTSLPVRVSDYIESKAWFFPLEMVGEDGSRTLRRSFDVEEEPSEHRERLRRLVEAGVLNPAERIWVSYGIPFLVPILAGYLAYLALGGEPLLRLIASITG